MTLSAPETLCTYRLPPVLHQFLATFPHIQVHFRPLPVPELRRSVLEGRVDVAFLLEEPLRATGLVVEPLLREPLLVVAPPEHPLTQPPLIFTEDESLALTLLLLLARQAGLTTTVPAIEGVLAKVERVLPASTRSRIQAVEQTVAFENNTARTAPAGLVVMVLSESIQSGRRVLLHYRSSREEVTERAFDPGHVNSC